MPLSRRTLGFGLLGMSAAATGLVLYGESDPTLRAYLGHETRLSGFVGGEKERFLADADVVRALRRHSGLVLDARRAGSVEMCRDRALLDQKPAFLWPSASVFVDLARNNCVAIRRDQVILNSPLVVYSWDTIARPLVAAGYAEAAGPLRYRLDLARLLEAVLSNRSWAEVGVPNLYGSLRLLTTDPNRSNSGFMFAGLAANLLSGEVTTPETMPIVAEKVKTIFARMGYKPSSSGKMFEDYLAGGPGAQPLVVGYENQLTEWILEDEARWKRLDSSAPAKPVMLYPKPTVFSAHPLIAIAAEAEGLAEALLSPAVQEIAWARHGFRGPLGTAGDLALPPVADRIVKEIDAVLPMPEIRAMLALLDRMAA